MYIGGGLGSNPRKAIEYDELIEPKDVLYYVEGMTNLFIAEGDYKNRAKARIRYIADRMGDEIFIKTFKEYVNAAKSNENLEILLYDQEKNRDVYSKSSITNDRLIEEKKEGLYSVYVQPIGGQLRINDLDNIIKLLEKYKDVDIRLSMNEGIYFRNLDSKEAEELLEATKDIGGNNELEKSVSCIGVPICQVGICNSQGLLRSIVEYFRDNNYSGNVMPKIFISGCHNSCGVHEIGKIGFTGKRKRVNEEVKDVFSLFIGGSLGVNKTTLGNSKGDMLPEEIPKFLFELWEKIKEANTSFDDFIANNDSLDEIINKYLV